MGVVNVEGRWFNRTFSVFFFKGGLFFGFFWLHPEAT